MEIGKKFSYRSPPLTPGILPYTLPGRRSLLALSSNSVAVLWGVSAWLALATPVSAYTLDINIKQTSIEELMQMNVKTLTRQNDEWQTTPAAIYVITQEDLQRAHITSLPDALRLVPGVQVARIDANKWAVSIRGFNSRTANKLLVMIDGRSIYDPLFAGVFWESRGDLLNNIKRIEVVRGPGGTLWGSNAVNGVINIITRHSADTEGSRVEANAGSMERGIMARHGWKVAPDVYARIFAQHTTRSTGYSTLPAEDEARLLHAGFRVDGSRGEQDHFMLKGHTFDGTFGERLTTVSHQDVTERGKSFTARWTRDHSDESQTLLQLWYDQFHLDNLNLGEQRDTYDVEVQHAWRADNIHRFVVGAGYRHTQDEIREGPLLKVAPTSRRDTLVSAFAFDEMSLAQQAVRLQLGVKVERNDYSGTEWQPSIRAAWVPDTERTAWAAFSRAVRPPSRLESDLVAPIGGNQGMRAEAVDAYEIGYRQRVVPQAWVDTTAFYNHYHNLLSIEGTVLDNKLAGTSHGVEIATRWEPAAAWRLDLAYTYLSLDLRAAPGSLDTTSAARIKGNNPRHQWSLRTNWHPHARWRVDVDLRYVSALTMPAVPSYLLGDVGVSWNLSRHVQVLLAARNLLDTHHPEQSGVTTTEVRRSFLLALRWEV